MVPGCEISASPSRAERIEFYQMLGAKLKVLGDRSIQGILNLLRESVGASPLGRNEQRAMTIDELRQLDRESLIVIGCHTVSHPSLGRLDRDAQFHQIFECKKDLENILKHKIVSIAYPFGDRGDFNRDTLEISKQLGFRIGLTTVCGTVTPATNPHAVPRMFVKNWDGADFYQKLQRFSWIAY